MKNITTSSFSLTQTSVCISEYDVIFKINDLFDATEIHVSLINIPINLR